MLLSERKNKQYIIVIDQYDDNLGRYIPKSHTVEAPTLVEALINCDHFRHTSTATHPSNLLSVREAKVYPQSFMDADQHNMINVLKELAHNHPELVNGIDEFAETFQSYVDTLNLKDCIRDTIFGTKSITMRMIFSLKKTPEASPLTPRLSVKSSRLSSILSAIALLITIAFSMHMNASRV